jgi:glutamate-ammonia-ligase adenylyltransferase
MAERVRETLPWPAPADPAAALRLIERFAALDPDRVVPEALLAALGGNAPYLADLALREPATLRAVVAQGPGPVVSAALARLGAILPGARQEEVAAALRRAKREVALAVAIADIGGLWPLERVTGALSDLAEAALRVAVAHLLAAAHARREIMLPHPEAPAQASGFGVLGMGKLGARELNFSSDIDLLLLHDPESGLLAPEASGAFFTRLARGLVGLIEARDPDGYVFRVDLRLRPDPAATPPAVALPAAIAYYESMGQNWERAAMLKARPVAGDLATGAAFLAAIRPFVWRRHLDFAAVADIHAVKRRIDAQAREPAAGDPLAAIAGYNVKLGRGGIREIEFLVQTLQLVWGGRDPALRVPATLEALRLLVRAGHLARRTAASLAAAYRFLRTTEHRLQMVADRQTHTLPERAEAAAGFALFLGFANPAAFAEVLARHRAHVQRAYREVFEAVPEVPVGPALDFAGAGEAPQATLAALRAMGYANPETIATTVRSWLAGRLRSLRSERARELLAQILPALLASLARQRDPEAAFARLDGFLARLPAGVQLLSLFQRNPGLLDRVAAVLGAAPLLSEHLARDPAALDGLLAPGEAPDLPRLLRQRLRDGEGLEEAIAIIRRIVREEDFAISVATLEARLDADAAGARRAALADAAIKALLPRVLADFTARHGRVRGGGLAVVLMGKAGGREMMAGSDLDLMLIYDHPPGVAHSSGARTLPASQWFIRAVHAFIAALTAPDASGPLYAVDMRLRPSGNKGPVAVSLAAFERYHAPAGEDGARGGAWTYERMALTRARVLAGPPALVARVEAAIARAIASGPPPARVRADAASMRARLARERPAEGRWDVKHAPGGMMEVEFIAQALQLIHAPAHPEVTSPTTREALSRLHAVGALDAADAETLLRADRAWRTVAGILRLTEGRTPRERLSMASAEALLRATQAAGLAGVDVAGLGATLDGLARAVRAAFVRLIGEIDA